MATSSTYSVVWNYTDKNGNRIHRVVATEFPYNKALELRVYLKKTPSYLPGDRITLRKEK